MKNSLFDCVTSGEHLTSCDSDGFCNHCGFQEEYKKYAISTSDGHDEDWTYYDKEGKARLMFEKMKSYETDIHLFMFNENEEYEVIDSWYEDEEK